MQLLDARSYLGERRGNSFSDKDWVCAWDTDNLIGKGIVLEIAHASNLDAIHLRTLQKCEALPVAVVSEVGHQFGVGAHVHIVRLHNLVILLGIFQETATTTTEGKDRSMEVIAVSSLGDQAAGRIVHCLVGVGIIVSGPFREVHVDFVVQFCVSPGLVLYSDLRLVSLACWKEALGIEGHPGSLVYQSRPHETRFGPTREESDHAALVY